jgi:modulator of FtsH protease HflK
MAETAVQHTRTTLRASALALLPVAILIGVYLTCTFMVYAHETAVVFRFGSPHREAGPGWHARLPAPLETITRVETTVQRRTDVSLPPRPKDLSSHPTRVVAYWHVKGATDFLLNGSEAEARIREAVTAAANGRAAQHENWAWNRASERAVVADAQARLDTQRLGINLVHVVDR